jgi:hypothetical protein
MTSPHQRDRGLDRVSRLTRWGVVIATAATGLFGFLLARPAATARVTTTSATDDQGSASLGAAPTTTAPAASSSKSKTKTTQPQLRAPAQQPQRSSRPPRVTSGGS